jgi:hypothetical protein
MLIVCIAGCAASSSGGAGRTSETDASAATSGDFRLEVTNVHDPVVPPPGDIGLRPLGPGEHVAAFDVGVTNTSPDAQGLAAASAVAVIGSTGTSLDFGTPDAGLLSQDMWASAETRSGTIYVAMPTGTVMVSVVFDPGQTGKGGRIFL